MNSKAEQAADVVVIGGGIAGLAAAAYVARAGRSVTVLERSGHVGGRAITSDLDGFRFNLGPHALYEHGPAARVLKDLGVPYAGKKPLLRARLLRDGTLHMFSMNPWHFATSRLLGTAGKLAIGRALISALRTDPSSVRHLSVSDWLEGLTSHEDVRRLVEVLVRVSSYGNDPARMSAEVAVTQLKLAVRGVLYLNDGWQTLVDGLGRAAEGVGARIVTNAKVASIEQDGAVRGVRLEDGTSTATCAVILANGPKAASGLANDASLLAWVERATPVRVACLDLGLSRLPRPGTLFSLGIDQPLYFSVHSATARLAPEGTAMIHVAKYLPPDDDADSKATERELEEFVDLVQPGWRDALVQRRFLPAMDVVSALATAEDAGLAGRPGHDAAGVRNLFLAGDWVGPEGWLSDASLASAQRAASLALEAVERTTASRARELAVGANA